jgi:hypothetical protein
MFAKPSSLAVRFVALALLTVVTVTAYAQSTAERVTVVDNGGRDQGRHLLRSSERTR